MTAITVFVFWGVFFAGALLLNYGCSRVSGNHKDLNRDAGQ